MIVGLSGVGSDFRRSRVFLFLYLPLAVFYVCLTLFWGRHDLLRVHREYKEITERLAGGHAQERAAREVAAGCRQAVGSATGVGYNDCLRASTRLVEIRAAVIDGELRHEKQQAVKKMLLFYLLVGVGLITLPLALLYGILYLLNNIRFTK